MPDTPPVQNHLSSTASVGAVAAAVDDLSGVTNPTAAKVVLGLDRVLVGTGSPAGVVAAPVGSIFLRTDGGTSTTLYVKETGTTTSSGWVAK